MTMVTNILKRDAWLGLPQRKFLVTWLSTILVLRGRRDSAPELLTAHALNAPLHGSPGSRLTGCTFISMC